MRQSSQTLVIAEAGVNHNGSLSLAKELVDAALEAGADLIKFQSFRSAALVSRHAKKAGYQKKSTASAETQLDMLRKLELGEEEQRDLASYCRNKGTEFFSTPFDTQSANLLIRDLKVSRLKVSSGDLTNGPLLLELARSGLPLILSTGMATLGEIEESLSVLAFAYTCGLEAPERGRMWEAYASEEGREVLAQKVTLLHCTTEYPAPLLEVNLRAIDVLRNAFPTSVGYSDHTEGITVPIAAVAMGATVIEKHFTLDRNLPGPDHRASLSPAELRDMVHAIRDVEVALGVAAKFPGPRERMNREPGRKSLIARKPISCGEKFTDENLTVKRPGNGISPMRYWEYLGCESRRDYAEDELVS